MKAGNCSLGIAVAVGLALGSFSPVMAQQEEGGVVDSAVGAGKAAVDVGKDVATTTWDTGKESVQGMGEAVGEVGGVLKDTGGQAVAQARGLWEEAVLPMLQRTTAALPILLKAIVLLLLFWIVGRLAGAGTSKLLSLTNVDNRAVKDWGMEGLLQSKSGEKRSLEGLVGSVVKWVFLLLGFIAFFNTLELPMVAGPLQNIVNKVVGVIPSLLKAFAILFAYWAVASIARMGVTKGLGAINFDSRAENYFPSREIKGEQVGPTGLLSRLLFYLILLFGIPPFLQALGQEALVTPLQHMLSKALAFIPNIVAAGIILLVGSIVATIVREVVTNFLAAAGADSGAEKLGVGNVLGEKKVSDTAGLVAYFFILVPIIISAVDSLQIKAISDPVKSTLESVLAAIPAVLVAAVIVFIGYAIAKAVRRLVENFLSGVGFDALPEKLGLNFLQPKSGGATLSSLAGTVTMVVILLLTAQQALASLGFEQLSGLVDGVVRYLPQLASGLLILFASLSLGNYASSVVADATKGSGQSKLVSAVARYTIYFLGGSIALSQLGAGEEVVTAVVFSVLGGTALALGLAFGLGGRDKAKEIVDKNL